MKRIYSFIALFGIIASAVGQDIVQAEYFIGTDPGYGNAVNIPVAIPGTELTLSFDVPVTGLAEGFHYLYFRGRDDADRWGQTSFRLFYLKVISAGGALPIVKAEYFLDTDPGYSAASQIAVASPAKDLTLSFDVPVSGIDDGFHYLGLRGQDEAGQWSQTISRYFYFINVPEVNTVQIVDAEYFIDDDPGYGNGTIIEIPSPSGDITLAFTIHDELNQLDNGFHNLSVRGKDALGRWGQLSASLFYKLLVSAGSSVISGAEYFIDEDPGFGNGIVIPVSPAEDSISLNFDVDLTGMDNGDHVLYIRGKNALNGWGMAYMHAFNYTVSSIGDKRAVGLYTLYPNPARGFVNLRFEETAKFPVLIKAFDISGKLIYSEMLDKQQGLYNFRLPEGIYLLKISGKNFNTVQKLIIE